MFRDLRVGSYAADAPRAGSYAVCIFTVSCMESIRRLSKAEAGEAATALARRLAAASAPPEGWRWECGHAEPDATNSESIGKTPRYWIALVRWYIDGGIVDGPSVIRVDLKADEAIWVEGP